MGVTVTVYSADAVLFSTIKVTGLLKSMGTPVVGVIVALSLISTVGVRLERSNPSGTYTAMALLFSSMIPV